MSDQQVCPICDFDGHEDSFLGELCKSCKPFGKRCQVCYEYCDVRTCSYCGNSNKVVIICEVCHTKYRSVKYHLDPAENASYGSGDDEYL